MPTSIRVWRQGATVVCLSWLLSSAALAQAVNGHSAGYNLKTVEDRPIPRAEHFALWKEVALKACQDSRKNFNLDEAECRSVINRRADNCIAKYEVRTPAMIHTRAESRSIGRNFMYCATPYYFCKGREVKTEAEVMAHCQ